MKNSFLLGLLFGIAAGLALGYVLAFGYLVKNPGLVGNDTSSNNIIVFVPSGRRN